MQKRVNLGALLFIAIILVLGIYLYGINKAEITGLATSQLGNMTAIITTLVSCTWSDQALNISFGSNLNPGTNDYNGSRNYAETILTGNPTGNWTSYNITVDTFSNKQANITIKGDHFRAGTNVIYISNATWFSNTTMGNGTNMIPTSSNLLYTDYDKNTTKYVAVSEPIGSSVWYRFWLDIPGQQLAGTYVGNYTMQCEDAGT